MAEYHAAPTQCTRWGVGATEPAFFIKSALALQFVADIAGSPGDGQLVCRKGDAMGPRYELKRTTNGEYLFNLKAGNGEVILTSERYATKAAATAGIISVRVNASQDGRYDRRLSVRGEHYFVLKAGNNEVVGTSEMYSSKGAMEIGIASVKTSAPKAEVEDLT